jgi:hypothetical protein
MPHKTRRAKMTETAGESRIRSRVPMTPQQEKDTVILRMAEESGRRSMEVAGKRIERGIRAALNAGESNS